MIYITLAFLVGFMFGACLVATVTGRLIKQLRRQTLRELRSTLKQGQQLLKDKHDLQRQLAGKSK